jgi:ABC-type uncharacterized transport system fused permease/ATPase subunit
MVRLLSPPAAKWFSGINMKNLEIKQSDYTLGIKELDNAIGGIRKGSNIMLIGPPMSQKEVILHYIGCGIYQM